MGDKPARFVGSNEWIGCLEVGMLVERFTGHPCRILTLGASEPVSTLASEFAAHFSQQQQQQQQQQSPKDDTGGGFSTPIMAGGPDVGGARTILGVANVAGAADGAAGAGAAGAGAAGAGAATSKDDDDDSSSQEPYLLVLDPHYTGEDDLRKIQSSAQGCTWQQAGRGYFRPGLRRYFCLPLPRKVSTGGGRGG
eukprot:g1314.t1